MNCFTTALGYAAQLSGLTATTRYPINKTHANTAPIKLSLAFGNLTTPRRRQAAYSELNHELAIGRDAHIEIKWRRTHTPARCFQHQADVKLGFIELFGLILLVQLTSKSGSTIRLDE
jgi:hypothetical protein